MNDIDRRTKRGKELAERLNKETVEAMTPKIYWCEHEIGGENRIRIGRTDWPGDAFNIISAKEFETFRNIYQGLGFKLIHADDLED